MIGRDFWDAPSEWDMKKLDDIVVATSGMAFDSEKFVEGKQTGTPLIRIRDIGDDTTEVNTTEDFEEKYLVDNGDILVSMDGEFQATFWSGGEAALNQRVLKLSPKDESVLNQRYLGYVIRSLLDEIEERTPSTTVKHLSKTKDLLPSVIPVPPIGVQKEIVETIEEQLKAFQSLTTTVNKLDSLTKEYESSILAYLLAGKEDLTSGTVSSKIDEEETPDHWDLLRIEEVIDHAKNGGTPKRSNEEYWDGTIPWLSSSEVRGKYTTRDPDEYITEKSLSESSAKIWPEDTVLVAMYGRGTIGRSAIASREISGNQAICGLIPDEEKITSEYLYYCLKNLREELASKGRGATASQQNLNQTIIKSTKIPVPPVSEQKQIVDQLEATQSDIEKTQEKLDIVRSALEEYRTSLFEHQFRGKKDDRDITEPQGQRQQPQTTSSKSN